ncbi:MAG: YnbE family lipoprotein [Legionellales bacterium]|nr:YnbE family lipoprotein [Legionellales bacterium]
MVVKQRLVLIGGCFSMLIGCTPTVKVEPSDKPITVNLNVNVEHKLKVQVDKDIENVTKNNPDLF